MKPAQAEGNNAVLASADLFGQYQAAVPDPPNPKPNPKPTSAPLPRAEMVNLSECAPPPQELDELDELDEPDDEIQLYSSVFDSSDTRIAKRMIDRMMADLVGKSPSTTADMFGHVDGGPDARKLDALIWMYDLNPDGSNVPFVWTCNEIGLDPERMRRITARSVRQDLTRILKLLAGMVSFDYAKDAELKLSDYINLTGWNLH